MTQNKEISQKIYDTNEIANMKPEKVLRYFTEITKIPRPSNHEEKIADYLVSFAKDRNLEYVKDGALNVLIKKKGQGIGAGKKPLLLQGHMDMVCEKMPHVEIDFEKDPISIYYENGEIRAEGTTLGADDGVAVAVMLALLDDKEITHPPLECLFTSAEETGLDGATTFDMSLISARRMINMDSEEIDRIVTGCCGGERTDLVFPMRREAIRARDESLKISVSGFCGGHSGENINEGRANANKVLGRILSALYATCPFVLSDIGGGSKDNAIPRDAHAVIVFRDENLGLITTTAKKLFNEIKGELKACDAEATLTMTLEKSPWKWSQPATERILLFLDSAQNGVIEMHKDIPGLVGFSRNMGVIRSEPKTVTVTFSSRSEIPSQLDYSTSQLSRLAALCNGEGRSYARYPGWAHENVSELRDMWAKLYKTKTGKEIQQVVIHAGLECGILHEKCPDMDIISVGPDMHDVHSPNEGVNVESLALFWDILLDALKELSK